MSLNIKDKNINKKLKELQESGELKKYPAALLRNSCRVRVNADDFLIEDEFILVSPYFNLPRDIYIYGKQGYQTEDNIYLNYWLDIFYKTIENGLICPQQFKKSELKFELTIGMSKEFRTKAYNYHTWTRNNIIEFLSCLFDTRLEEANYQQQDLLELMAA